MCWSSVEWSCTERKRMCHGFKIIFTLPFLDWLSSPRVLILSWQLSSAAGENVLDFLRHFLHLSVTSSIWLFPVCHIPCKHIISLQVGSTGILGSFNNTALAAHIIYYWKTNDKMIMNGNFERPYETPSILKIKQHLPRRAEENKTKFWVRLAGFMAKMHTRDPKI